MLTLRRRLEQEEGVTLILFVFLMVALLGLAGLVVDFGLVRNDRQRNKSAADVAVAAGLQALNVSNAVVPARGACEALDYLKVNHTELSGLNTGTGWTNGSGTTIPGGDPCDSTTPSIAHLNLWSTACTATAAGARSSFVWFTGSTGDIDVKIRAGFDATDINSGGFADEAAHPDKGAADQYGCDQLAIIVTERETAGLGRIVGGNELQSTIRSVGRVTVDDSSDGAVALLLIEPEDCGALDINGYGAGTRVLVKGLDSRPGIIHADSVGSDGCGGSSRVLMADGASGIVSQQSPDGTAPGMISLTALGTNPTKAYDGALNVNVVAEGGTGPQEGGAKGRAPVDERFLGLATATNPSYGMTKLRSDAAAAFAITNASQAATAGYTQYYDDCGALPNPIIGPKVFIHCDVTQTTTFADTVTDVTIKGNIDVNGGVVTIPNPRNVFVYGETGPAGDGVRLGSSSQLLVNNNGLTGSNVCTNRQAQIQAAADPKPVTKFVVGNGTFTAGSNSSTMRMCGTTLFLMDGDLPSSIGTAPAGNSHRGSLNIVAGATLEWTAPNRTNLPPTAAQIKELEDLAFWSETSGGHSINGSGASMLLKGIFFTPNADAFKINAGGAGIDADAQFITRKLEVSGGGTLSMTADPNNSVPIKIISGYSLVR